MPEEEKKEDDQIILHVDMDCRGCQDKVRKALRGFKGIEGLNVSMEEQKVTIKGKLDARQVCETVKKKSGRRTVLLYPDPQKLDENAKKAKEEPKKEEPPPPEPEVVVVLKVNMHCAACAKQIRKSLMKMDGVTDAKEDFAKSTVTVTGKKLDPDKLCARVRKRSGKHCEVVPPPPPPPPPKEEEKKEDAKPAEEKKEDATPAEEKKEEAKAEEAKPAEEGSKEEEKPAEAAAAAAPAPEEAKPKAKEEEKKEEEKKEAAPEEKKEEKEEEKKDDSKEEEKKEEKKEEATEETKTEAKKYEYVMYRSVPEHYVYPPQIFSDENPNSCTVM